MVMWLREHVVCNGVKVGGGVEHTYEVWKVLAGNRLMG